MPNHSITSCFASSANSSNICLNLMPHYLTIAPCVPSKLSASFDSSNSSKLSDYFKICFHYNQNPPFMCLIFVCLSCMSLTLILSTSYLGNLCLISMLCITLLVSLYFPHVCVPQSWILGTSHLFNLCHIS